MGFNGDRVLSGCGSGRGGKHVKGLETFGEEWVWVVDRLSAVLVLYT